MPKEVIGKAYQGKSNEQRRLEYMVENKRAREKNKAAAGKNKTTQQKWADESRKSRLKQANKNKKTTDSASARLAEAIIFELDAFDSIGVSAEPPRKKR